MDNLSKYLSIPWKDRGRDFAGCDCWGWVRLFLRCECGVEIEDLQYASCRDVDELWRLANIEKQRWRRVKLSEALKGDVVDLSVEGCDYHVGVMVADNCVGHLEVGGFPRVANLRSVTIKNRIRGIYRYAAV